MKRAPNSARTGRVAPAEDVPPPWALALRALVGSIGAVVVASVLSLWGLDEGYAGVHDAEATTQAVAAHLPFLERLGWELSAIGLVLALVLFPIVFGLLLLARNVAPPKMVQRRALTPAFSALAVVLAFSFGVAHARPGLFLALVARSSFFTWCTRLGHVFFVVVLLASALGFLLELVRRSGGRSERRAVRGLLLVAVVGYPAFFFLPGPPQRFPAIEAAQSAAKRGKGKKAGNKAKPKDEKRPNVVILAVDSLRPDRINAEDTPNISRLLAESIYFPNTLVTQPRTGPSWAAALTGLPPLQNGVETMFPSSAAGDLSQIALPAHLTSLGYRSAVFSEYAGEFFRRCRFGFQVVSAPVVELREITGQTLLGRLPVVQAAASVLYTEGPLGRWLIGGNLSNLIRGLPNFAAPNVMLDDMRALLENDQKHHPDAPFLWLAFYSQPHFPYTSSSRHYTRYTVPGSAPELAFGRDVTDERPLTTEADVAQLRGLYQAALAETDEAIGRVRQLLTDAGEWEDSIVVLTADHGEGLYDCPTCVGHGDRLTSLVTLRVPLAFRLPSKWFPRASPGVHDGYASQLDLYPTLLELLREEKMAHHEGKRLLRPKGELKPPGERTFFAETGEWLWPTPAVPEDRVRYPVITEMAKIEGGRIVIDERFLPEIRAGKHRAVIRPPYKLSYEPGALEVKVHLYDIVEDPFEEQDLAASEPERVRGMMDALRNSMLRHPQILDVAGYFLSRPPPPPPEKW